MYTKWKKRIKINRVLSSTSFLNLRKRTTLFYSNSILDKVTDEKHKTAAYVITKGQRLLCMKYRI